MPRGQYDRKAAAHARRMESAGLESKVDPPTLYLAIRLNAPGMLERDTLTELTSKLEDLGDIVAFEFRNMPTTFQLV
jgi:hypothetical protein